MTEGEAKPRVGCLRRILAAIGGAVFFVSSVGLIQLAMFLFVGFKDPAAAFRVLLWVLGLGAVLGFLVPREVEELYLHKVLSWLWKLFT